MQIASDFARVYALPMGRPALFYRKPGSGSELELAVIDTLLRTALVGFEEHLREHIPGYDDLPPSAKIALLDMAHHLSPAHLLAQHPRLIRAVAAGAWSLAATASFRHGPGAARNQWTAALFRAAATSQPAEGPLKRFSYGMVGLGAALISRARNRPAP